MPDTDYPRKDAQGYPCKDAQGYALKCCGGCANGCCPSAGGDVARVCCPMAFCMREFTYSKHTDFYNGDVDNPVLLGSELVELVFLGTQPFDAVTIRIPPNDHCRIGGAMTTQLKRNGVNQGGPGNSTYKSLGPCIGLTNGSKTTIIPAGFPALDQYTTGTSSSAFARHANSGESYNDANVTLSGTYSWSVDGTAYRFNGDVTATVFGGDGGLTTVIHELTHYVIGTSLAEPCSPQLSNYPFTCSAAAVSAPCTDCAHGTAEGFR